MPVDFTIQGSIKKNTISKSFSSFFFLILVDSTMYTIISQLLVSLVQDKYL